jgi:hypothetical protein
MEAKMFEFELVLFRFFGIRLELFCANEREDVWFRFCIGDKHNRYSWRRFDWSITVALTRQRMPRATAASLRSGYLEMIPGIIVLGLYLPGIGGTVKLPPQLTKLLNRWLARTRMVPIASLGKGPINGARK